MLVPCGDRLARFDRPQPNASVAPTARQARPVAAERTAECATGVRVDLPQQPPRRDVPDAQTSVFTATRQHAPVRAQRHCPATGAWTYRQTGNPLMVRGRPELDCSAEHAYGKQAAICTHGNVVDTVGIACDDLQRPTGGDAPEP